MRKATNRIASSLRVLVKFKNTYPALYSSKTVNQIVIHYITLRKSVSRITEK